MKINFIKYRRAYYFISGLLIVASLFIIFYFGLKPGIDLAGGSMMELAFENERPSNQAALEKLSPFNLGEAVVQPTGEKGLIIKTKELDEAQHQAILQSFEGAKELSFESIGPTIGNELRQKTKMAIIMALVAIALYVALAFQKISRPVPSWKYGIATLIALLHDVIIPL